MATVVTTSSLRQNLADAIKSIQGKKDYLLIQKRGNITSAIVDIDLFEDLLALSNHKYLVTIKDARKQYKKGDVFSHDDVFGDLS